MCLVLLKIYSVFSTSVIVVNGLTENLPGTSTPTHTTKKNVSTVNTR